eukprot:COSAG02_NODE_1404_length_12808_cov_64.813282_1_plen_65_part_00
MPGSCEQKFGQKNSGSVSRNIGNFNSSVVSGPFFLIFEKWTTNDQKIQDLYPVLNISAPYHAKV